MGAVRSATLWVFQQIRDDAEGRRVFEPTLRDLRCYIDHLYAETRIPHLTESNNVSKLKKYLNFIGQGIGPDEAFLHGIRRAATEAEFFGLCDRHLDSDAPFPAEPPVRALLCTRSEALAAG